MFFAFLVGAGIEVGPSLRLKLPSRKVSEELTVESIRDEIT